MNTLKSAIYQGKVRHRRFTPRSHEFEYRVCYFYLDLSEIEKLFAIPGLFSHRGPSLFGFNRAAYLDENSIRDQAEAVTGTRPQGPIRMLTQIEYLGFTFNPVTFYYCFDESGETVEIILAEITNTPWNERHTYVLRTDRSSRAQDFEFKKEFHVSPFIGMNETYRWRFSPPGSQPGDFHVVHMETGKKFDATLTLQRQAWTPSAVLLSLVLYPLMTFSTVIRIYFQALRLWLKRVPVFTHPKEKILDESHSPPPRH